MDDNIKQRYNKLRQEHPFMPASHILRWAKTPDESEKWDPAYGAHEYWEREVEGFTITLKVHEESIYPVPDRHGVTDYGKYVDEVGLDYNYDWDGQWPKPSEDAPLNLPYTSIRYSGPGWVQGEGTGYFIPDGIEEQFDHYRRQGQSKQVAWDLTKQWAEDTVTMLFSSPLTNCVVRIIAEVEDIELASTSMGTEVSGDDEGRNYIFQMVDEHGMIEEVIEEARRNIAKLTEHGV